MTNSTADNALAMRSEDFERLEACPICSGANIRFWTRGRDRLWGLTEATFEYDECQSCNVVFARDRPTAAASGKFYPAAYAPHTGSALRRRSLLPEKLDRKLVGLALKRLNYGAFQSALKAFHKNLIPGSIILDFGCGSGAFLDAWRARGCITIGMDFSENALAEAARRGHRAVGVSQADWNDLASESVDFIRMNHVVEHLYDPRTVIANLRRVLKPGGRFHLATPNPMGASAQLYRNTWFSLDCPRHTILFPPTPLVALLKEAGFPEVVVLHEPLAKDMARSWAYGQVDRGLMARDIVEGLDSDGLLNLRFSEPMRRALQAGAAPDRYHLLCSA